MAVSFLRINITINDRSFLFCADRSKRAHNTKCLVQIWNSGTNRMKLHGNRREKEWQLNIMTTIWNTKLAIILKGAMTRRMGTLFKEGHFCSFDRSQNMIPLIHMLQPSKKILRNMFDYSKWAVSKTRYLIIINEEWIFTGRIVIVVKPNEQTNEFQILCLRHKIGFERNEVLYSILRISH